MGLPRNFALALDLPQGANVETRRATETDDIVITASITIYAATTVNEETIRSGGDLALPRILRLAGKALTAGLKAAAADIAKQDAP